MRATSPDGDLPAGVQVLQEGPAGGNDEGRAMADLVHAIAPGAQILFHTATGGEADFAAGIAELAAAGARVIVDDVAYLDEPFFQDGSLLQQAVEQAVAQGVSYFTSASNEGRNFYDAAFSPTLTQLAGLPGNWVVADFGEPGAPKPWIDLTIPMNGQVAIDLQWDQPFAGIGAGHGAANSLAMALYTSGGQLIGTAGALTVGQNPEQLLQFANTTGQTGFRLVVVANGIATPPGRFKFIAYGNATIDDPRAGQGSGTVTGHELVAGANTVGAMAWSASPRFGGSDQTEQFSSVGPGSLLFDCAGQPAVRPAGRRQGQLRGAGRQHDQRVRAVLRHLRRRSERRGGGGADAAGQSRPDAGAGERRAGAISDPGAGTARRHRRGPDPGGRGSIAGDGVARPRLRVSRPVDGQGWRAVLPPRLPAMAP